MQIKVNNNQTIVVDKTDESDPKWVWLPKYQRVVKYFPEEDIDEMIERGERPTIREVEAWKIVATIGSETLPGIPNLKTNL